MSSKKYAAASRKKESGLLPQSPFLTKGSPFLAAAAFFLFVCLSSASTVKAAAMTALILAVAGICIFFKSLYQRITLPMLVMFLFVAMCGISTFYADGGKFALEEFVKILGGFSIAMFLLAVAPGEKADSERWMAAVLAGAAALISLVSIDLISTRLLSTPVVAFLNLFSGDYAQLSGLEAGVRMNSLLEKPNVYAGVAGIGVLLSLGLSVSEPKGWRRNVFLVFLYVNALGFLLSFSMGASAMIALAFVAYLFLETKEHRFSLLVLMVETFLLSFLAVVPIAMTSFTPWTGLRPIPLLCAAAGAALLCLADLFVGQKLAMRLHVKDGVVVSVVCGVLALGIAFVFAGYNLTGGISLRSGESLRRAAYPEGGYYTVAADGGGNVQVTVESQNDRDTMMHTSTVIYQGELSQATFTVPEDSLVVYFNFAAAEDVTLEKVTLQSSGGNENVPLGYKLLPGFIANRLQGLFANQNAIQRTVFFKDGMKLFSRSPVIGLGLGAYENSIRSVQSFLYDTKYAHNHYIQVLAELGIVGLILFVGMLAVFAAALLRARKSENASLLLPALGAALVFMAGHAAAEVVFSTYCYLPFAFGAFVLMGSCGGDGIAVPRLAKGIRKGIALALVVLLAVYGFCLGGNMRAKKLVSGDQLTPPMLMSAVDMDFFEWPDYALTYLVSIPDTADEGSKAQANAYAARLSKLDSNIIPSYLAEYYLRTGQTELAFAMAEKYVDYVAADPAAWNNIFHLLASYEQDTAEYRAGVRRIAEMMEQWNAENLGTLEPDSAARDFLSRMEG